MQRTSAEYSRRESLANGDTMAGLEYDSLIIGSEGVEMTLFVTEDTTEEQIEAAKEASHLKRDIMQFRIELTPVPQWCYFIPVDGFVKEKGFVPSRIDRDKPGHSPLVGNGEFAEPWYWGMDYTQACNICYEKNLKIGVSPTIAEEILSSSIEVGNRPKTINLEPHWPGLYRFLHHIEKTDPEQFKKMLETIGEEDWEKIKNLAGVKDQNRRPK